LKNHKSANGCIFYFRNEVRNYEAEKEEEHNYLRFGWILLAQTNAQNFQNHQTFLKANRPVSLVGSKEATVEPSFIQVN
jgi:hypothetical protein